MDLRAARVRGRARLALFLALSSCSSTLPVTEHVYQHSLNLEGDGTLFETCVTNWSSGAPPSCSDDVAANVNEILRHYNGQRQVLIFVHGGINSIDLAIERTARVVPKIEASANHVFPVFINWESRLQNGYADHLFRIRDGKPSPVLAPLTSPAFLLADVGRAITRLPVIYGKQGFAFMKKWFHDVRVPPPAWATRVALPDVYQPGGLSEAEYLVAQVLPGVLRVATTPALDTMKLGYSDLLRRTKLAVRSESDYAGYSASAPPTGPVSILMRRIAQLRAADPNLEIVLVGHSMGTILLNQLVRSFPKVRFDHIVYMAAACTIDDFEDSVLRYMQTPAGVSTRFHNLVLHPQADRDELHVGGVVPNGSVLEWVDDFVLDIETPTTRTLGKWNNVVSVLQLWDGLDPSVKRRLFVKGFPVRDDGNVWPSTHGSFDDFAFWEPNFWDPSVLTAPRVP